MNKLLLLTTGLLLATGINKTIAQSHISLGPVASLGHSWVSNMPGDRDFKLSPAMGVGIVYSRNAHWGFGGELLVSHEGYKADYRIGNGQYEKITVNPVYLRVPMHATYFFGKYGDVIRPKVYAGPTVGVRIDEKQYSSLDNSIPAEGAMTNSNQFRHLDLGLNAGVGANVKVYKNTWLNVDAGYYHGLLDVIQDDPAQDYNANRNLRLNVGLMWGL